MGKANARARRTYESGGCPKLTIQSNVVPKEQEKDEKNSSGKQQRKPSTLSGPRCFKCQDFRHIALDFPNRRMVALIKKT